MLLVIVSETLTDEILQKMHAPAKPDLPVIKVDELTEPDGLIFGKRMNGPDNSSMLILIETVLK